MSREMSKSSTVGRAEETAISILPGAWLGVVGGGQLGRMFCHAAQRLGYRVAVLDPDEDSPAGAAADLHIVEAYDSPAGLSRLAERCAAVTTEFENVPAASLNLLAQSIRVAPHGDAVALVQDRITEKRFVDSLGIAVAPYRPIHRTDDFDQLPPELLPGILKLSRLGYDGKGQVVVRTVAEARQTFLDFGSWPCVLEARLDLACEISVLVVRGTDGALVTYPVAQNEHRNGILAVSTVPAPASNNLVAPATGMARFTASKAITSEELSLTTDETGLTAATLAAHYGRKIAEGLGYQGVLCVEFFILRDGRLVVNEIAPRPHNSGHYTIDACVTSQFEQQVRALTGMPLGCPNLRTPSVMLNILGDSWYDDDGRMREPDWTSVLAIPGACLHLYGKHEARRGRKMGHVTCLGRTSLEALQVAQAVGARLGIPVNASQGAGESAGEKGSAKGIAS